MFCTSCWPKLVSSPCALQQDPERESFGDLHFRAARMSKEGTADGAADTGYYFINACPFPEECNSQLTMERKKKLRFRGHTHAELKKCICEHLVISSLHPWCQVCDDAESRVDLMFEDGTIEPQYQPYEQPREASSAVKARLALKRKSESEAEPLARARAAPALTLRKAVGPAVLNFVQPPSPGNLLTILDNAANAAFKAKAIADGAAKAFDEVGMQLVAAKADLIAHMQADSSSRAGSSCLDRT